MATSEQKYSNASQQQKPSYLNGVLVSMLRTRHKLGGRGALTVALLQLKTPF